MPPVISVLCAPSECLNVFTSGSAWKSARNSGCAAVQLWFFGPQPSIYVGAPLCNCGSSDHSLRWCPAPFANVFSLLNPEFVTHDADGSIFETWKQKMRHWHRRGPNRQPQGNGRRSALVRGAPHYLCGAGRELPVPGSQPASDGDAMWSPSRSIATLNGASAIIASSSSLLVRVVLLLVRVELLPDPEPALLLLLLTHTPSPIEWEL